MESKTINRREAHILEAYQLALALHNQGLGQRRIARRIKTALDLALPEATVSNWIYNKSVPFANRKTQFKPILMPSQELLFRSYIQGKRSASELAEHFKTTPATVISWLRKCGIPVRSHKESMMSTSVREKICQKRLRRPTVPFEDLSPSKAYILGVAYGDGFLSNVRFRVEVNDFDFLSEVRENLLKTYGLHYTIKKTPRGTFKIDITNHTICADLYSYGRAGTFVWRVPSELFAASTLTISSFLRGFFDSEGSVGRYQISAASANSAGLRDVQKLLAELEIISRFYTCKNAYTLSITHRENILKFASLVGFSIRRKQEAIP